MTRKMFDTGFDPFDALIELNERLNEVEKRHNLLAIDYQQKQRDLTLALKSIQTLQTAHMSLREQFLTFKNSLQK